MAADKYRHGFVAGSRFERQYLADLRAAYNERWGLEPGACNCHHGSARNCPIHTQADYDAATGDSRQSEGLDRAEANRQWQSGFDVGYDHGLAAVPDTRPGLDALKWLRVAQRDTADALDILTRVSLVLDEALAASPSTEARGLDVERLARALHEAKKIGGPWSPCMTRNDANEMVPVGFDEDPNGDFACLCRAMASDLFAALGGGE